MAGRLPGSLGTPLGPHANPAREGELESDRGVSSETCTRVAPAVEVLLVVIFVALIVAGVVVFMRGRERVSPGAGAGAPSLGASRAEPVAGDIRGLKPGDVVNYDGGDFIVEGTVRLEQDGFRWAEHRIVDGERSHWLSVEDDEGLEVVVWDRVRGGPLEPGPDRLEHAGATFELDERGHANFTAEGSTGTAPSGRVEFVDYEAGDRRLSFERYGDGAGWEMGTGTVISEHVLDIYPSRDP